jgi:hypothetical protein
MKPNLIYVFKIWLTAALIAPLLYFVFFYVFDTYRKSVQFSKILYFQLLKHYPVFVFIYLAFTILPWLLMLPLLKRIQRLELNVIKKKIIIVVSVALLLTIWPLIANVYSTKSNINDLSYYLSFLIPNIVFAFWYKFAAKAPIVN